MTVIENFRDIPINRSVLYQQVFNAEDDFIKHLDNYLSENYDSIVVLKFREHLPTISTVWKNLYVIDHLQNEAAKLANPNREAEVPIKLIGFNENDWFAEFLAVLGGLAAVIQLIYTIIHDRKIETKRIVTEARQIPRTIQRDTGSGQVHQEVIYQSQTFQKSKSVERTSIGDLEFTTESIGEYYTEELELIEIYS